MQELADPSPVESVETDPVKGGKHIPVVDTNVKTNQSSTTSETKRVDETMEDKSISQCIIGYGLKIPNNFLQRTWRS